MLQDVARSVVFMASLPLEFKRAVHDRDGNQDALHRQGLIKLSGAGPVDPRTIRSTFHNSWGCAASGLLIISISSSATRPPAARMEERTVVSEGTRPFRIQKRQAVIMGNQ